MYWTDPTLYGATLPQRELPITAPYVPPFYGQGLPMQGFPQREFPVTQPFISPFFGQGLPMQGFPQREFPVPPPFISPFFGQGLPMQGLPWQNAQRFMPPVYPGFQGFQPTFPQFHGQTPFMMNPYMTAINQPYGYGFQKPFPF